MMNFVSTFELNNQKYQTNETLRYDNYKGKLLFIMTDFLSFVTYHELILYMSKRLLK